MNLEINDYGICLDSNWCYIALSWKILVVSALVFAGYKFYKRKKNK